VEALTFWRRLQDGGGHGGVGRAASTQGRSTPAWRVLVTAEGVTRRFVDAVVEERCHHDLPEAKSASADPTHFQWLPEATDFSRW
jgi:hypothetical protein